MKKIRAKHLLAFIFLLLLWSTIVVKSFHLFKIEPLKGFYTTPENIALNFNDWTDGSYAAKKENYIKNTFALRPIFVRIYGQLTYSLFGESANKNVLIGKQHYMYERQYIDAWYGDDFIGEDNIRKRLTLLKELQDTLRQKHVFLFTVFAPGKGAYYPEYIPADAERPRKRTNYKVNVQYCKSLGINLIDFEAYFLSLKGTSRYPLYPRCGIHWSDYAEFIAFDSIVNYLRQQGGINMPVLKLDSIQVSKIPRFRDYDMGDALNIFTRFRDDSLAYPFYSVSDSGRTRPKFLCIADSYYYHMHGNYSPLVFNDEEFWYYFNELHSMSKPLRHTDDVNLKQLVLGKNAVCLLYTDASLKYLGNGFIEQACQELQVP